MTVFRPRAHHFGFCVALALFAMSISFGCSSSSSPSSSDTTHKTTSGAFDSVFHVSADSVLRLDSFGRVVSGITGPVAISGDGNIVAFQAAGPNNTTLAMIYNANTGALLRSFPILPSGIFELNRDGSRLFAGFGRADVIYDAQTGNVVHDFGPDVTNRIGHLSSTGDSIVFLTWPFGHDYNVFLYSSSGTLLQKYPLTSDLGHTWWLYGYTNSGKSLVIAQSNPSNVIYVLNLQTGALRDSVNVNGLAVQAFEGKTSRDGEVLAAFSSNHMLQGVYPLKSQTFSSPLTLSGNPFYEFSDDHKTMAASLHNVATHPLEILDIGSGSVLRTLWSTTGSDIAQSLAYSDDGSRLVVAFGAMGRIWTLK